MSDPFAGLPRGHFKAIYADPAWSFRVWSKDTGQGRSAEAHYVTMSMDDIAALPVADLAAPDCVLFMWACWPSLPEALSIIEAWGFTYKTCGFDWVYATTTTDNLPGVRLYRNAGCVPVLEQPVGGRFHFKKRL